MGLAYDPDRTTKIVSEARQALATLAEIGEVPREAFLDDRDKVGNAKYTLIVAIEACLDLAHHVISANDLRMPEDYADAFHVLAEQGAIEDGFADRLGEMARFRNRLVHIYWDVDDARVHDYIRKDADDVGRFLETMLERLDADG